MTETNQNADSNTENQSAEEQTKAWADSIQIEEEMGSRQITEVDYAFSVDGSKGVYTEFRDQDGHTVKVGLSSICGMPIQITSEVIPVVKHLQNLVDEMRGNAPRHPLIYEQMAEAIGNGQVFVDDELEESND